MGSSSGALHASYHSEKRNASSILLATPLAATAVALAVIHSGTENRRPRERSKERTASSPDKYHLYSRFGDGNSCITAGIPSLWKQF